MRFLNIFIIKKYEHDLIFKKIGVFLRFLSLYTTIHLAGIIKLLSVFSRKENVNYEAVFTPFIV